MSILNNDINKDPRYTSKSKINRKMLREMHIPDFITVRQVKKDFDECVGEIHKIGSPYDQGRQRHTKFVSKFELYNEIVKGRSSRKK